MIPYVLGNLGTQCKSAKCKILDVILTSGLWGVDVVFD